MANGATDSDLREAARHRGLRLVKSRKRKPGAGDFGRFGLEDSTGQPVFGVGKEGLTASAQEIADYLRRGDNATWAESARVTPARSRPAVPDPPKEVEKTARRARKKRTQGQEKTITALPGLRNPSQPKATRFERPSPPERREAPAPEPVAKSEPALAIRLSRKADAPRVAALLGEMSGGNDLAAFLAASVRSRTPVIVAEQSDIIGLVAWHLVPTLQHGAIGRVSLLFVAERFRRRGIGTKLLAAAEEAMRQRHCALVEVMSDIGIRNTHGFFRALDFEQASYRFLRKL